MKKIIFLIMLLPFSLFAEPYAVYQAKSDGKIKISWGTTTDVYTFCRNGLQWVYADGVHRTGLSLDRELIDKNDPTKGTKVIVCDY